MPFIESSQSLRAKAHASETPNAVLIGVLVIAVVGALVLGGNVLTSAQGASFELEESSGTSSDVSQAVVENSSEESSRPASCFVFVSGAVANPGVYELASDARVGDAVAAAGGFVEGAASEYNNLARVLVDGEQIHVPSLEELESADATTAPAQTRTLGSLQEAPSDSALVNLNTATQSELESLPGIGPATASKIIASRDADGPFSSTDELMRVSGIGEKKFAALEGLICV